MNKDSIQNWFQFLTAISVLIGLGLVVWELQETKQMVRAQLASDQNRITMDRNFSYIGENNGYIWVKGCLEPNSLTDTERFIYGRMVDNLLLSANRPIIMEAISDFGIPWEGVSRPHLSRFLGTRYGSAFFGRYGHTWSPELRSLANQIIESGTVAECATHLEELKIDMMDPSGDA